MYDDLIKRLRNLSGTDNIVEFDEAAYAIEELQGKHFMMKKTAEWLAEKVPKWIPVTERLPAEKTYVIILFDTIAGKMAGVCFLYKDDEGHNCWTWLDRIGRNLHDIQPTHWMPLPKWPEEE